MALIRVGKPRIVISGLDYRDCGDENKNRKVSFSTFYFDTILAFLALFYFN